MKPTTRPTLRSLLGRKAPVSSLSTCGKKRRRFGNGSKRKVRQIQSLKEQTLQGMSNLDKAALSMGMEDHRRLLRDSAKRIAESHRMGARSVGMEDIVSKESEGDDMGDIIVTGDIQISGNGDHLPWMKNGKAKSNQSENPSATQPAQQPANGGLSSLAKAGLVAAALSGVGGPLVGAYLATRQPTLPAAAPFDPANFQLNLGPPVDKDGNLIPRKKP